MSFFNPQLLPNIRGNRAVTGEWDWNTVSELRKALEAGWGTDMPTLTGAAALRIQSLDRTMMATIEEDRHFVLFNELAKSQATATVDEFTEHSNVGGRLGGSANTETGSIRAAQGRFNRRVGLVKFLMTRREVSFVAALQHSIVGAEAVETLGGVRQLLRDCEHFCFEGDEDVVPSEFSGIRAQIEQGVREGQVDSSNIIDLDGAPLDRIAPIADAAATIAGPGNFGKPTHLFLSYLAQADLDVSLDPAFRVPLTDVTSGGVMLGAPVVGIRTSHGSIKNAQDVHIRDERGQRPLEAQAPDGATWAAESVALRPASVTTAVASDVSSRFTAARAGNYFYLVTGTNETGESTGVVTAAVAVAQGQRVDLTITRSAGAAETGYVIYRSRRNGTNAPSDMRLVRRVPVSGAATTVFRDLNHDIPGSTTGYLLNMTPGHDAITWRQMLPMTKFSLYPAVAATIPWSMMMFGYLRISKRRQHAIIKNIVPSKYEWKPF